MLRKLLRGIVWLVLLIGFWSVMLTTPPPVYAFAAWAVCGYLIWRAWPGVKADLLRISALIPGHSGQHGGRVVTKGRSGDL